MRISIAIPCYEAHGFGASLIEYQYNIFEQQIFKDFEVIISDHSENYDILDIIQKYPNINTRYIKNTILKGNSSANINNALKYCSGEIIKIIFQDDFLADQYSLQKISDNFLDSDQWMVTACDHSTNGINRVKEFYPSWNDNIHLGNNTISSPSVLSVRNSPPLYFDENLIWLMDVDLYKRYYTTYGAPHIINDITVVNRQWDHQLTNKISEMTKITELHIMKTKYE